MEIFKYTYELEEKWDEFVLEDSINGTFLQTRNFLNYHQVDLFEDCSVLIRDKEKIVAVVPACETIENEKRIFFSHKGSTFGGIVICKKYYRTSKVLEIIDILENYFIENNFNKIVLKMTSEIFVSEPCDLIDYCLYNKQYAEYKELSTFVDINKLPINILDNFNYNKVKHIKKGFREQLVFRPLYTNNEIEIFYKMLHKSLEKYDVKPVHKLEELLDFKDKRLNGIVEFHGVFKDDIMIASGMSFYMSKVKTIHLQYSAADDNYRQLSPMSFFFYSIINLAKDKKYSNVSWGISTENNGSHVNLPLIESKEAFGSSFCNNRTYYKSLT